MAVAWELSHSVETDASPAAAWNYWTNIANWSDPPATFELDGPFAVGSQGITRVPGQAPLHWVIQEVHPMDTATIKMQLEGATFSSQWRFEGLAGGGTRLTQRIELEGENAEAYISQLDSTFRVSLPEGMKKIAAAMASLEAGHVG
jgi:polyketide cyclase/dehydrase/lipid transport protein